MQPRARPKGKQPAAEVSEDVVAGIAAVDAAAAKLPAQESLAISVMEGPAEGGFGGAKPSDDPPNLGNKARIASELYALLSIGWPD